MTAKALGRITMRVFLVGANENKKRTLKSVQLRILGSMASDGYFRVSNEFIVGFGATLVDLMTPSD